MDYAAIGRSKKSTAIAPRAMAPFRARRRNLALKFRLGCIAPLLAIAIVLTGCQPDKHVTAQRTPRLPQQAGQPLNSVKLAGRMLAMRASAVTGNTRAIQAQQVAMQKDVMRSMRIPDPSRRIDPEAARAAVGPLEGVRGVVWLDRQNLMVMVGGARYRSMQTIDNVCMALQPLGDTLAVVVNVQNTQAVTSEQADTLSRNCQLPEGQRAFAQPKRQVNALDPEVRRQFEAQQGRRAK